MVLIIGVLMISRSKFLHRFLHQETFQMTAEQFFHFCYSWQQVISKLFWNGIYLFER